MAEFTEEDDCYLYVRRAAAHNAAHALIAWSQGYSVRRVWLDDIVCGCEPVEVDSGLSGLDRHIHASRAVERQCRILLAGPLAESMFSTLPPESRQANLDLHQAKSLLVDLCGTEAIPVLTSLIWHTRAVLSENSWTIAILVDGLLKRGGLDNDALISIFNSSCRKASQPPTRLDVHPRR